jgi:hypothetical protein
MALLTAFKPTLAGVAPAPVAAAGGGDSFDNQGHQLFYVKNGGGGSITVTFDAPNPDNFGITDNAHDNAVAVAAGAERWIGPFPTNRFNDANGRVQVAYTGVTTVTVDVMNPAYAA